VERINSCEVVQQKLRRMRRPTSLPRVRLVLSRSRATDP